MEHTSKQQDVEHNVNRRVRELYRFYQPAASTRVTPSWLPAGEHIPSSGVAVSPNTPPVGDGSGASNSSATSRPESTVDPQDLVLGVSNHTLVSFAQLAALQLDAERAVLCVLDRDVQHIIAEATKSVKLCDSSSPDPENDFWLGSGGSRRAWSVCKDTVALSPSNHTNDQPEFLVVNDLAESERFKRLSFVENHPHFRFYAGTPLTTEKNINLGCFFVLDTKPRDGLTSLQKETLGSLTTLVMDYLRLSRQCSEGRRAARLSRGLSYFVEGSSSFVDSIDPSCTESYGPFSATPPSTNPRISISAGSRGSSHDHASMEPSQSPSNDRSLSNDARSICSGASDSKLDAVTYGAGSSLPEWLTSSSRNRLPPDNSQGNSWCFRRAANLIRESLDLTGDSGVVFLEANNSPMLDGDNGSDSNDSGGPATVLSMSTNDEPFSPQPGSTATLPAANIDRAFLQLLLRRYPKGKLWSFHPDGLISTSDDDDQESRDRITTTSSRSPPGVPAFDTSNPMDRRRKASENPMLNKYFPGATQIIFVPLWNAVGSQWFAGCFCWSTIETQVFTSAVELSSILGFGSSIMAEYSRVESLIADRQKGDFIGSISHELRSPLHGILAAAEFLNTTHLNEFQDSLLETINACGRTLLDTMNQVLDFSKVVSLERTWRSLKRRKESPLDLKGTDKLASHLDTYIVTDLAILAEEVVEGICLGLAYGQSSTASADLPVLSHKTLKPSNIRAKVEVAIDVAQQDWVYRTQPGALRRIIMNIFGNAMKYTESGRVTLRLEASSQSEGRSLRQGLEDLVTLTVSDTGKGISQEFLRGRIYTPFAQEDSLAVGTGLGLSIVRSLVKALNGSIRIRSRPGEGTIVRVSLPLARPVGQESPPIEPHGNLTSQRETLTQTLLLREGYPNKRAAIWGIDPEHVAESSNWAEIGRYLTEWYGIELVSWPFSTAIDILLVDEPDLHELRNYGLSANLPALLILCHKSVDYSVARFEWASLASSVDIIRHPCGPHKLARSVLRCLTHSQSASTTPASHVLKDPMDLPIRTSNLQSTVASPSAAPPADTLNTPATAAEEVVESTPISNEELPPTTPSVITAPPQAIVAAPLPSPLVEGSIDSDRLARVLVVDDNRINLNLMMTFLKKRKLTEMEAAENGKLAVEAVERLQNGYDIIFMDMSMPVMNGFEATRAIRALEKERDGCGPAVIIALTGLSSSRDESEALASGVDLFLTKPVSFKEVSRLMDEWEKDKLSSERKVMP